MVSFRPLSRSLPLVAASRSALFHSCAPSPVLRHAGAVRGRAAAPVYTKLGGGAPAAASPGLVPSSFRALTTAREKVKVLLVLYDGGKHAEQVPELLGTTENELGLRKWLEDQGHTLVTTSDKEGENSKFDQELVDAEVIITTP
ncbi:Formate dehydrogenase [Beauveria bassiana D1-5]|nr:Formate dehydrogenase [Beauveria bassiana D1-5]